MKKANPTPVKIVETAKPIPVVVEEQAKGEAKLVTKDSGQVLAPTTTEQEDIVTAGQRRVNMIWEFTQAFIAIVVILSNMIAGVYYAFTGRTDNIPAVLSSSLFLIIGFYFSRTNHQAIGGEGKKPSQKYVGR